MATITYEIGSTPSETAQNLAEAVLAATEDNISTLAAEVLAREEADAAIISGNVASATKLQTARTVSITGDVTGSATFDGTADATIETSLAASGVTAGSYGPSADASPASGGTVSVPEITVDAKGRVTSASTKSITLPADITGNAKTASDVVVNGNNADLASGRGQIGELKAAGSNVDLNAKITSGNYFVSTAGITNAPATLGGVLCVYRYGVYIRQVYYLYSSEEVYTRHSINTGTSWSTWMKFSLVSA